MTSDYSIEQINNRFVVWRLVGGRKLRQGSHATYDKAFEKMSESMERLCKRK